MKENVRIKNDIEKVMINVDDVIEKRNVRHAKRP
jgi:hypothetical protein